MDEILLEQLALETRIGVYDWEQSRLRTLWLDIALFMDTSKACQTDCLEDALDYSEVAESLRAMARHQRWQLLEACAESLCTFLLRRYPCLQRVKICIRKVSAVPGCSHVGVRVSRSRD
jgi:dihydroneopterin aldolase